MTLEPGQINSLYSEHVDEQLKRANTIIDRAGLDSIVIHSGEQKYMFLDDMTYAFKANPLFKAWLPLVSNPNCWIILRKGEKPTLLFFQPVDFWHSVPQDPTDFWVPFFDIKKVATIEEAHEQLPKDKSNSVYLGEFIETAKKVGFSQINSDSVLSYFHFHRGYKTKYEHFCLREANKIAVRGHLAAKEAFYAKASEFEISLEYQRAIQQNINEAPYGLIIALNENGAVLHYTDSSRKKFDEKNLHSFLIDAGASFHGYAADITRTYSYRDDEFSELIAGMHKKELELVQEYKLGTNYGLAHIESHKKIAELLSEFKFINLSGEEIYNKDLTKTFYPHGLGHHLGLQVHDVGAKLADDKGTLAKAPAAHPNLRATRTLGAHMAYTVEPGLYFIDSLLEKERSGENSSSFNWDKINEFKKFGGIRIEDNIILHEDKIENMTRDLGLN
jgi:Xaa-Pro dipeptidase